MTLVKIWKHGAIEKPQKRAALGLGALAIGAAAIGGFAIGALSVGALSIGTIAIGKGRIKKLRIGELTVDRLTVKEQVTSTERRDSYRSTLQDSYGATMTNTDSLGT